MSLARSFSDTEILNDENISKNNNNLTSHPKSVTHTNSTPNHFFSPESMPDDSTHEKVITVIRSDEVAHDLFQTMKVSDESSSKVSSPSSSKKNFGIPIRIVHMAGTHGFLRPSRNLTTLPAGHILVHSGNFTRYGKYDEFVLFDSWLDSVASRYQYRIVVIGEDDAKVFGSDIDRYRSMLRHASYVLFDSSCEVLGIRFHGISYKPPSKSSFLSFRKKSVMEGVSPHDVLVTYEPAHGVLDLSQSNNGSKHAVHSGNRDIGEIIKEFHPQLHLHGGSLESRGISFPHGYNHNILTLNSSMCDPEKKSMYGSPQVVKCVQMHVKEANLAMIQFSMDDLYP